MRPHETTNATPACQLRSAPGKRRYRNRAQSHALQLLAAIGVYGVVGCSLVVSPGQLNEGCADATKACFGECVPIDSTEFGCASDGCSPCAPKNAQALCDPSGRCVVAACFGSWQDCDGDSSNGCEVNLDSDVQNCGACDRECDTPRRGEAACGNANCYVRRCDDGFDDCNWRFDDGCEVALTSDPDHCGKCDHACDSGSCEDGSCVEP